MEKQKKIIKGASLFCLLFFVGGVTLYGQPKHSSHTPGLFEVYSNENLKDRDLTYRDVRLMHMQGTDTKFSMSSYTSLSQWKKRRQYLQDHILVTAGLWPTPPQIPLNDHVFDKIEHPGYTVEKVYVESYPDFYLAGNLYRPKGKGPFPGILTPHGHWKRGRLQNDKRASVPGRSISLARQGYVVFSYDMVGYGDTRQIGHRFGAGDSLAQMWGINLLGLQLRNSKRALEFLQSLPDVDSTRIGITGASGGGTQTFLLDAVTGEKTIDVSAPVNMISAIMQGGDLCENAPGLRLNTFNVEIAALFAPRPQLMIANTHDWTKNTPWVEYPMMQSVYELYNAGNHVKYGYFDYPHNYNKASREAVYHWFYRWLPARSTQPPMQERPFRVEPDSSLLVFLTEPVLDRELTFKEMDPSRYHRLPAGALQMDEMALKQYLKKSASEQLNKYWPTNQSEWARFDSLYGSAYRHIIAATSVGEVNSKTVDRGSSDGFIWEKLLIERTDRRDWIPAVLFKPPGEQKNVSTGVTLIITPTGKSGIANPNRTGPGKLVRVLLDHGQTVLAVDVFKTGEHVLPDGVTTSRDENESHFTTFNKTDTQERIQDILTVATFLKERFPEKGLNLVGLKQAGVWCMLAAPLTPVFDHIMGDMNRMQPDNSDQWLPFYIPGLRKYGDLQTALALTGKQGTTLTIFNASSGLYAKKIEEIYEIMGHSDNITFVTNSLAATDIISFLIP